MVPNTEYHVLLKGFNLNQRKGDNYQETDLRHYRFPTATFTLKPENGYFHFMEGKEDKGYFPISSTTILVEQIQEKESRH